MPISLPSSPGHALNTNPHSCEATNASFTPSTGLRSGPARDIWKGSRMGLDRWFESQLHPESIDQTALGIRLAQFPAMQWNIEDLLYRLPSNGEIRQVINGRAPIPEGGTLHAIYENQIYRIQERKAEKAEKQAETAQPANAPAPNPPPASPAGAGKVRQVLASDGTTSPFPMTVHRRVRTRRCPAMRLQWPLTHPSRTQPIRATIRPDGQHERSDLGRHPAAVRSVFHRSASLPSPPNSAFLSLAGMQPPEFDSFIQTLRPVQRVALNAGLNPELKLTVAALENPERLVAEELMAQRLTRDIYSNAQLQEVMTDFWLNHFNVYLRKNEQMPYYLVSYERDTIRPHSLGKFEDLLKAVAHSPAMLAYLDNAESVGPHSLAAERADMAAVRRPGRRPAKVGLNENYSRELMELHTLGVNGGYTQADVTEVARVLTGWTIDRPMIGAAIHLQSQPPRARHEKSSWPEDQGKWRDGRPRVAALSGHPSGYGPVHQPQAGNSLRVRRSSAELDRSHGKGVPGQRRRHRRGTQDAVPLSRVLVHRNLSRESQNAH